MNRFAHAAVLFFLTAGPTAAADPAPAVYPTAILEFHGKSPDVAQIAAGLDDVLFARLSASDRVLLVERKELDKILKEQELNLSGVVKPGEALRIGQLTGAKLLVTGSVVSAEPALYLVAKIISTETSRTIGASVKGKSTDSLEKLGESLAAEVEKALTKRGGELVPPAVAPKDLAAELKRSMGSGVRPKIWLHVTERHVGQATIDPAVETELTFLLRQTGFEVLDKVESARGLADVVIEGEAFSEFAVRHSNLVSVKARIEIKAVDRKKGTVIAAERQTEITAGLAEQIAGKTALQNGAAAIAERLLPRLVGIGTVDKAVPAAPDSKSR